MTLRRILAAVVIGLVAASGAMAAPRILGGGTPTIVGPAHVGQTVHITNVPAGATCAWFHNGTPISGATSCSGYTIADADAGLTLTATLTIAGVTVSTDGVAVGYMNFSIPANSGFVPLLK